MNVLISGALHEDRLTHAKNLSMAWLCTNNKNNQACGSCHNCMRILAKCHPNLTYIEPAPDDDDAEKKSHAEIKIEQVRRIIIENQKANYEPGPALFIITHIHQITKAAANALLKSIEESSENKSFLCLAPSRSSVLPTIASRLISIQVKPTPLTSIPDEKAAHLIASITKIRPNERFKLCEQLNSSRAELYGELENLREQCHTGLRSFFSQTHHSLHPLLALQISQALDQACDLLDRNINPRLVIEQLLLRDWPHA